MNNIFVLDGQTDEVLGHINKKYVIDNEHEKDLPSHKDYFWFTVLADNKHAVHLNKRNGLIVPGEDGELLEFRIFESIKYRDNEGLKIEVHALATYLDLKNQKVFDPQKTSSETAQQHAKIALQGTEWQLGEVDFKGIRTLEFDSPFNSYDYILRIAREFELETRFYVTTDGHKVTGRYVDLVERIGEFRGRTVEFGRDLQRIERKEDTSNVVTALWVYGPEKEDGTRLKVFVEDDEARERWGRKGKHIVDYYEPETENEDIAEERLVTLGEMELRKRINAVVTYEAEILDLENIPGLENKKIRFGDTIRIKDVYFNPPLYVEARVFNVKRDVFNKAKKTVQLGDYREYTEEEVKALFRQMQAEIRRRLERLVLVSIISSAGNVFKNGVGSTELTAKTFLSGNEVDEDGTKYEYRWHKFNKNGDYVPGFYEEGKTITVNASDIDEKASFRVEIILDNEVLTVHEITLTNVFDGEDGEPGPPGPKGEDGKTFYTWIKYADTPTSGMSDSPEGKEYIGIAYNKETPTPSTNYADYVWSKFKGDQGIPGPPGKDGQPTYTWVKYADDEHGNGMSDSPEGKLYIGLAFNKTTPEESNNPADYTWSLMPQNIEVSGRNLFRPNITAKNRETSEVTRISPTSFYVDTSWAALSEQFSVEENEEITVSFWAKNKSDIEEDRFFVQTITYDENGIRTGTNSFREYTLKKWKFYSYTFTVPKSSVNSIFHMRTDNGDVWINGLMIVRGNKAPADWSPAPEDVQEQIDEAKQEAQNALNEAQNAMSTADGKNAVFRQSSTPPTTNRKIGDLWFDTANGNKMYTWTGSWTETKLDYQALAVNKLSAISADLGNVTAGHIEGVTMNLANGKFNVDENGNVTFKGHLEGASGSFSGDITGSFIYGGFINLTDSDPFEKGYDSQLSPSGFSITYRDDRGPVATTSLSRGMLSHNYLQLDGEYDYFMFDMDDAIFAGALRLGFASNTNNALEFPNGHMISVNAATGGFYFYGNRTNGQQPFVVRSHVNESEFRTDFEIDSNGFIRMRQVTQNTVTSSTNVRINPTSGLLYMVTSSRKFKHDIQKSDVDFNKILDVNVYDWFDKNDYLKNNESTDGLKRVTGLIADEIAGIGLDRFVDYDERGEIAGLHYDRLWTLLIPVVKDLKERLDNLEAKCECGR